MRSSRQRGSGLEVGESGGLKQKCGSAVESEGKKNYSIQQKLEEGGQTQTCMCRVHARLKTKQLPVKTCTEQSQNSDELLWAALGFDLLTTQVVCNHHENKHETRSDHPMARSVGEHGGALNSKDSKGKGSTPLHGSRVQPVDEPP